MDPTEPLKSIPKVILILGYLNYRNQRTSQVLSTRLKICILTIAHKISILSCLQSTTHDNKIHFYDFLSVNAFSKHSNFKFSSLFFKNCILYNATVPCMTSNIIVCTKDILFYSVRFERNTKCSGIFFRFFAHVLILFYAFTLEGDS